MTDQDLYNDLNTLSIQERIDLAYMLLLSVEGESDEDTTSLWIEESERRYAEYCQHRHSIPAREVLNNLAARLADA
jgi:hypothetical protein